jgi:hypothetical protein
MSDIAAAERPPAVVLAASLWVVSGVSGVVGAATMITVTSNSATWMGGSGRTGETVAAVGVILVGWGLVRAIFAWFLLRGSSSARMLLTTVAGLSIATVFSHANHVSMLNWVAAVSALAAIIVQFQPAANMYFAEHDRHTLIRRRAEIPAPAPEMTAISVADDSRSHADAEARYVNGRW